MVIGHRGAAGHSVENTLHSFEMAWKMGADYVELDVQESSDGELVVIHDYDLERIAKIKKYVAELDLKELQSIDLGDGAHIPTLGEVLDLAKGKFGVNIEIKRDMLDSILFSSFLHATLSTIKSIESNARIGILYNEPIDDVIEYAKGLEAYSLNPLFFIIDEDTIVEAHRAGMMVYPWTVDNADFMVELLKIGVDGIIPDLPDIAVSIVDEFLDSSF